MKLNPFRGSCDRKYWQPLASHPRLVPAMPMQLVDVSAFRPRLMVEEAQALELVQRACAAAAACAADAGGAAAGAAAAAAPAGGATAGAVGHDPALVRLFEQHSAGDTVVSVQVSHVQRLWAGMGAVLEVEAQTASGVSAALIVRHFSIISGVFNKENAEFAPDFCILNRKFLKSC